MCAHVRLCACVSLCALRCVLECVCGSKAKTDAVLAKFPRLSKVVPRPASA